MAATIIARRSIVDGKLIDACLCAGLFLGGRNRYCCQELALAFPNGNCISPKTISGVGRRRRECLGFHQEGTPAAFGMKFAYSQCMMGIAWVMAADPGGSGPEGARGRNEDRGLSPISRDAMAVFVPHDPFSLQDPRS